MDGSNAWPESHPDDEENAWKNKEPFDHFIIDRYGNKFRIWRFLSGGGEIRPHTHPFPHDSHLIQGAITVTGDAEGRDRYELVAPDSVFFDAGVSHSVRALVDKTVIIHSYPPEFTWKQIRYGIILRIRLSARRFAVKIGLRSDFKDYDPAGMA